MCERRRFVCVSFGFVEIHLVFKYACVRGIYSLVAVFFRWLFRFPGSLLCLVC